MDSEEELEKKDLERNKELIKKDIDSVYLRTCTLILCGKKYDNGSYLYTLDIPLDIIKYIITICFQETEKYLLPNCYTALRSTKSIIGSVIIQSKYLINIKIGNRTFLNRCLLSISEQLLFLDECMKSRLNIECKEIIEGGIDLSNEEEMRYLKLFTLYDCHKIVKILMEKGLDPLSKDETGVNSLQHAADQSNYSSFKVMLKFLKKKGKIDQKLLRSVAYYAAGSPHGKNDQMLKRLYKLGLDPNIEDESYGNILYLCLSKCLLGSFMLFFSETKDKNKKIKFLTNGMIAIDPTTIFSHMILLNHLDFLYLTIEYVGDINLIDGMGETLLHTACSCLNLNAIRFLLKSGADPNILDSKKMNSITKLLHSISQCGSASKFYKEKYVDKVIKIIKTMIMKSAQVDTYCYEGKPTLYYAAFCDIKIFKLIELYYPDIDILFNGNTLIGMTFEHKLNDEIKKSKRRYNLEVFDYICEKTKNINCRLSSNDTPLIKSTGPNLEKFFYLLLKHGADVNLVNDEKKSVIYYSKELTIDLILSNGFDFEKNTQLSHVPILYYLTSKNRRKLCKKVFETGKADLEYKDSEGDTILSLAVKKSHNELALYYMQNGCNVDHVNKKGLSILHLICQHKNMNNLEEILKRNCDLNPLTPDGKTPLMLSCKNYGKRLAIRLLDSGADPSIKDKEGYTCLEYACKYGETKVVEKILSIGLNSVNNLTYDNNFPLYIASRFSHYDIVKLLLQNGADKNMTGKNNSTALDIAKTKKRKTITSLLQNYNGNNDEGVNNNNNNNNNNNKSEIIDCDDDEKVNLKKFKKEE